MSGGNQGSEGEMCPKEKCLWMISSFRRRNVSGGKVCLEIKFSDKKCA